MAGAEGPVSVARLLAWADPGAGPMGALWPAYRLVDVHAPEGPAGDPRATAFGALWRSTIQDLVEQLLQRVAWQRNGVVGFARLGSGR
jgi:hypothetical protein